MGESIKKLCQKERDTGRLKQFDETCGAERDRDDIR